MLLPYTFDEAAREEPIDATFHYELDREGLGEEFRREILRLISEIREHPTRWPTASKRARRHRADRFPYTVIYQVLTDEIRILAVAHAARRPGYWRKRQQ